MYICTFILHMYVYLSNYLQTKLQLTFVSSKSIFERRLVDNS